MAQLVVGGSSAATICITPRPLHWQTTHTQPIQHSSQHLRLDEPRIDFGGRMQPLSTTRPEMGVGELHVDASSS